MNNNTFVKDLMERVIVSFLQGFLTVTGFDLIDVFNLDWKAALAAGGGMALLSLIKGMIAKFTANPESASLARGV